MQFSGSGWNDPTAPLQNHCPRGVHSAANAVAGFACSIAHDCKIWRMSCLTTDHMGSAIHQPSVVRSVLVRQGGDEGGGDGRGCAPQCPPQNLAMHTVKNTNAIRKQQHGRKTLLFVRRMSSAACGVMTVRSSSTFA